MAKNTDHFEQLRVATEQFRAFLDAPQKLKDQYYLAHRFALFRQARLCNFLFLNYISSRTDYTVEDLEEMNFGDLREVAYKLGIIASDDQEVDAVRRIISEATYYTPYRPQKNKLALEEQMPMVCAFFERVIQQGPVASQTFKTTRSHS